MAGVQTKIDAVKTLSFRERNGTVVSLRRMAYVSGMPADAAFKTDYRALVLALEQAGIPEPGTNLQDLPGSKTLNHLLLTERIPVIKDDASMCEVELLYEAPLVGDNNDLLFGHPDNQIVYGEMTSAMQQTTTNFYHENGDRNKPKQTVLVGHLYPNDDAKFRNRYMEQGGEIHVFQPQHNFRFGGYWDTNKPWLFAKRMLSGLNEKTWMGEPPKTWMVVGVSWKLIGNAPFRDTKRYLMRWELQNNPDGWNPTAIFIDERTHRPPKGLRIEGVFVGPLPAGQVHGARVIPYYPIVNYDSEFPALFEA